MKLKKEIISLIVIITGFLILSFLIKKNIPVIIAAAICMPGFFWFAWAQKVHGGWMFIARVMGWVNSRILLFIVFYFILTPIAFFTRLSGKLSFEKKYKKYPSSFIHRGHLYVKSDLENPW
jgi:hypothetical protein